MLQVVDSPSDGGLTPEMIRIVGRIESRVGAWPPQRSSSLSPRLAFGKDLLDLITKQLDRIRAVPVFEPDSTQEKLFLFLVRKGWDGEDIAQKDILEKFFPSPPHPEGSTIARTTVALIRKRLAGYYQRAGRFDPVTISFPLKRRKLENEATGPYTPLIQINSNHDNNRYRELAFLKLRTTNPEIIFEVIDAFLSALDARDTDAICYYGLAEAMLAAPFHTYGFKHRWSDMAREFAQRSTELYPDDWHGWAALGAACLVTRVRLKSTEYFEKALSINRSETESYSWYHFYLIAAGRLDEGLRHAQSHAHKHFADINANVFLVAAMYLVRDFKAAAAHALLCATDFGYLSWLQPLLAALIRFSAGDESFAIQSLFTHQPNAINKSRFSNITCQYAGLLVLLGSMADPSLGREDPRVAIRIIAEGIKPEFAVSFPWLQTALAVMSLRLEEISIAIIIECLTRAEYARDPLMLFVLTLPLLDPLRDTGSFKEFRLSWAHGTLDFPSLPPVEVLRERILALVSAEPESVSPARPAPGSAGV